MIQDGAFLHENSIVEPGARIGEGTRVWAFAHILPGAQIGADCNICDHTFIENEVIVGDRVTIKSGVQLWDGVILEEDVFVGPNATFTNDKFPRSKNYPDEFPKTVVRRGASIGANATILPGITIGAHAMVGAGAVVTRSVPPNAIVVGNPARIQGYVSTDRHQAIKPQETATQVETLSVQNACLFKLPRIEDLRGGLTFGEYDQHLPFLPRRYFVVFDVPSIEVRGEHAHKTLQQVLICLKGSCSVVLDDGLKREQVELNRPDIGLYLPPKVWGIQYNYSPDAVLLVLASQAYDPDDYIRDYDEFLAFVKPYDG
jgi:acetyltransferase-like isoleucine patch superfamily enzyme